MAAVIISIKLVLQLAADKQYHFVIFCDLLQ